MTQFEVVSIKPAGPSVPPHGRLTRLEALIVVDTNKIMAAAGSDTGKPGIASVFQATVDAIEQLGL